MDVRTLDEYINMGHAEMASIFWRFYKLRNGMLKDKSLTKK